MIFAFIFFIGSIFLYFFAPDTYSHEYCVLLVILYSISSGWIIHRTIINNNYFNFHVLFLISFFFVNFVYPVFLYPISPDYFPVFNRSFNHDVITKATALAFMGSSSYNLGVSMKFRKEYSSSPMLDINFNTIQFLLTNLVYLIFIVLLFFAGSEMLKGNFGSTANIPPGLLVIFQVSLGLSIILIVSTKTYKGTITEFMWKFNKPILAVLFFYILLFIYTGDRGPVIQIVIITVVVFTVFVRSMKLKTFIVVILAGMFFLTFISYARSKNANEIEVSFVDRGLNQMQLNSFFDLGMDLIVNNRNLYVGYDYANKNGLLYGKNMYYYIFSPVPFLPSLTTNLLFNSAPRDLTTAMIITKEANASYGLGTNIIADLYMAFGVIGVILFMFLLGFIITKFQIKANYSNNFNYIIAYVFLVGFSIYLPRTSILDPLRHIIWAIIIFILLKNLRLLLLQLSKKAK